MVKNKELCPACQPDIANTTSEYETWLQCDACSVWYHAKCLNINKVDMIERFHCTNCVVTHGPTTMRPKQRKSNRGRDRLNYADLNEGKAAGDERIWGKILEVKKFRKEHFKRYKAKEVTVDLLRRTGMKEPFLVEENEPELDMKMPPADISAYKVAELVGKDTLVDVIDVASQSEISGWTLSRWADYFHSSERDRIRNVLSLEISDTDLAELIVRPKIVRELDWIDLMWPDSEENYPKARLYCLMGTKDSYTDFHIDFGGSSVFYHILRGSKTFYFIEPTDKNLKKYQKWSSSPDQSTTFLGDLVKDCYSVEIKAGNTMIIPTGWIHAVYTPEDSFVIGGNFLHSMNIMTQLKIHRIEEATEIPLKYRYPYYKRINWYALKQSGIWISKGKTMSKFELEGIIELAQFLREEITKENGTEAAVSNSIKKANQIPDIIKDPIKLTHHVEDIAKKALLKLEASIEKPKNIIRLVLNTNKKPDTNSSSSSSLRKKQDDYEYLEDEEDDEEEEGIEEEDDDDDEYQEDYIEPNEYDKKISIGQNDHTTKKIRKPKKVSKTVKHDDSSDDEDSMGTAKSKSINKPSLFSNRKRSLSTNSNSSQPTTAKQRILGMINKK